ncbi:ComF family protein [Shimwellia pseudoproteus]|uniref:ComF family protein n=1 Tax=Shimwellia pseudoproteus TaxID=570012 RepID=UPI0018EDCE23|nr:ComF family protein [Shimwellia pseudoproteus]MBJ3813698.1 ComF family protein [Shimwellia pseudoproteus]
MQSNIRQINGRWDLGYAMDKHIVSSIYIGDNEYGHPQFETNRTPAGEALYRLKYRADWEQIAPLAHYLKQHAIPLFHHIGFIVPMPASTPRERQPVTEIARALGSLANIPCFDNLLVKAPGDVSLKNLNTREEKMAAIENAFSVNPVIANDGRWNVLLIDDLYHTGTTAEAACMALRRYTKVDNIYVAALTWKPS